MPQNTNTIEIFADCVLDIAIKKPLSYKIPPKFIEKITKGMRVIVPLRQQLQKATVINIHKNTPSYPTESIQDVLFEQPKIQEDLWLLSQWIAKYYATPLHKVFKLFAPPSFKKEGNDKKKFFLSLMSSKKKALLHVKELRHKYPTQALVLDFMLKHPKGIFLSELLEKGKISSSPIDSLVKKKILVKKEQTVDRSSFLINQPFFPTKPKILNKQQKKAFAAIFPSIQEEKFAIHLLFGITGSGKTEVYMQLIQSVLDKGKTVIFLVPEVSLTPQFIEQFTSRFEKKIAVLHHKLSIGQRFDTYKNILGKKCPIVIGARSSIFCPIKNLGLIIVDEEHDSSYKQSEKMPTYHARDVALMRAKINNCPAILGSATPSLESYTHAVHKKYHLHHLTKRAEGAIADIKIVNMKEECEKQGRFTYFSNQLLSAIKQRYENCEQTILFLNRRGYHTTFFCKNCSWIHKCPHCDLSLTFHKKKQLLCCHLCFYSITPVKICPQCTSKDQIHFKGFGTEQVEKALHAIFPNLRILRADKDTTQRKLAHDHLLKQFRSGKADVLIGTQMITKGLHFPSCSLVGIISIDSQLQIPDFRASESVFQLITQVAGRAGRSSIEGEVILQTFLPDNPIIQLSAKQDYLSFYREQVEERKIFSYPPFCRLGKIVLSSKEEEPLLDFGKKIRSYLLNNLDPEYQISPITPCGYAKIKDHYRYQCLIKGPRSSYISQILAKIYTLFPHTKVQILLDINPLFTYF